MCAHALAHARARTFGRRRHRCRMDSGHAFEDALGEFASEYSSQNRSDYRAFIKTVRSGRIEAMAEG
jgi:hypothetical protein